MAGKDKGSSKKDVAPVISALRRRPLPPVPPRSGPDTPDEQALTKD